INVPLTLLAIVVAVTKMRESRSATPPPLDIPGLLAFTVGLFFLVLGFMRGESDGWTSSTAVGTFAIAVVALIVCEVLQVTRPGKAMFDRALFTNVTFNGLSVV